MLAPFLTDDELKALWCRELPFDAIALYVRVFCYLDVGKQSPIYLTQPEMTKLNGSISQSGKLVPMKRSRIRTTLNHLKTVHLVQPSSPKRNDQKAIANPVEYIRGLAGGLRTLTPPEFDMLNRLTLDYASLALYVRLIRPKLNVDSFYSVFSHAQADKALTFDPYIQSREQGTFGYRLIKPALNGLVEVGLITLQEEGDNYYIVRCNVSQHFSAEWLKSLTKECN